MCYIKLAVEVTSPVQNLVPSRERRAERPAKQMLNKLGITACYILSFPSAMFGKPFAYLIGQENKLFPPKKKTDWP